MALVAKSIIVAVTIYSFSDQIKDLVDSITNSITNMMCSQLIIDTDTQPKSVFAIKETLLRCPASKYNVVDAPNNPRYKPSNGRYCIEYDNKYIYVYAEDTKITLCVYFKQLEFLKTFMNKIYAKHCTSDNVIVFYSSQKGKWSFPIFRRPRNLDNIEITSDMNDVLKDVNMFMSREEEELHKKRGLPYRKGYLFEGLPGAGKTTLIEIIAMKYNMSVYMINLNAKNMTDEQLINLIGLIPPKSIIAFEEIEKQLVTLNRNSSNMISNGGILSALDGPQRIGHNCIIILTANNTNELDDNLCRSLFRQGRIDKCFKLHKKKV